MSPIPPTSSSAASAGSSNGIVTSSDVAVDKNMFLQLLVAQLQNQDPMNPTDSNTFVTQLAQFQQLEATVNMGTDLSGIHTDADQLLADYNAAGGAGKGAAAAGATGASGTTEQTTKP
jgi:flagellar basal-body rod modification protein FlgD